MACSIATLWLLKQFNDSQAGLGREWQGVNLPEAVALRFTKLTTAARHLAVHNLTPMPAREPPRWCCM